MVAEKMLNVLNLKTCPMLTTFLFMLQGRNPNRLFDFNIKLYENA